MHSRSMIMSLKRQRFLQVIRHPLYKGSAELYPLQYHTSAAGWQVDLDHFDPSTAIGDINTTDEFEIKHDLNVYFECCEDDVFIVQDDHLRSRPTLYLFSFLTNADARSMLELLEMPVVAPTHTFDCTTGRIGQMPPTLRSRPYKTGNNQRLADPMPFERNVGLICYYCGAEECYDECSQI